MPRYRVSDVIAFLDRAGITLDDAFDHPDGGKTLLFYAGGKTFTLSTLNDVSMFDADIVDNVISNGWIPYGTLAGLDRLPDPSP